ncbi:MAG: hypothetical protein RRZ63_03550, partial [Clostridium sp.]
NDLFILKIHFAETQVQVALTNEDAYEEIVAGVGLPNLTAKGINLAELSNSDKNPVFQSEFYGILGVSKKPTEIPKFSPWSSKAAKAANAVKDKSDKDFPFFGSAVYIQIDKDMKVTVWIGKQAASAADITSENALSPKPLTIGTKTVQTVGTTFFISK